MGTRDTEWFARCGWGVFCHYLTQPETTAEAWNRQVDEFSVAGLAAQLETVKARYFFVTVGQGSGHHCAPNETYDRYAGISPSKCSRRDLVSDLYDALHPLGIELLVYVPAHAPSFDREARKGLKMTVHWNDEKQLDWRFGPHWAKYRLPEAQRIWQEVCRDWATRFGRKIRGWWVDGAYAREYLHPENELPNLRTLADALRAGNPEAILAFNPGVSVPITHYIDQEILLAARSRMRSPNAPAHLRPGRGGTRPGTMSFHTWARAGVPDSRVSRMRWPWVTRSTSSQRGAWSAGTFHWRAAGSFPMPL